MCIRDSSIYVPSAKDKVNSNIYLYSINYENNTIEYIWQLPENQPDIVNFTLFWYWTDENPVATEICVNVMNWTHLPPNATRHRVSFEGNRSRSFRSFISVNTKHSSSGLIAPAHSIFPISRRESVGPSQFNYEMVSLIAALK